MKLLVRYTESRPCDRWEINCQALLRHLPVGSKVTAYEIREKEPHEKFDNQSRWLVVEFVKGGMEFKTIFSHKNNQFLRISLSSGKENSSAVQ